MSRIIYTQYKQVILARIFIHYSTLEENLLPLRQMFFGGRSSEEVKECRDVLHLISEESESGWFVRWIKTSSSLISNLMFFVFVMAGEG